MAEPLSQRADRWVLEHLGGGKIGAERLAYFDLHAHEQKRIAAEIEETIVDPDYVNTEKFLPDAGQHLLSIANRSNVRAFGLGDDIFRHDGRCILIKRLGGMGPGASFEIDDGNGDLREVLGENAVEDLDALGGIERIGDGQQARALPVAKLVAHDVGGHACVSPIVPIDRDDKRRIVGFFRKGKGVEEFVGRDITHLPKNCAVDDVAQC